MSGHRAGRSGALAADGPDPEGAPTEVHGT